ncbi:MAG: hypothetical protein ACLPQ6_06645 [Steroidobacteraceae bacterium]
MIPLRQITRRLLKWSGIAVGSLVLLALILFAIAFAINMRDEPLSPKAMALLKEPPNPYRPEQNLYVALLGFDAPAGESVIAAGQARIDRYNSELDRALRDPSGMATPTEKSDPRSLQFKGTFEFPPPAKSYWNEIPPHRQEVEKLLNDNRELYERYLALHHLRGYFQSARPSIFVPIAYLPQNVRPLFLANLVLRIRGDDPGARQQGLADLEDDLQLWRVMLAADGTFLSKMVAIAYLHAGEQLLADAIADPRASIPVGADDAQAVAPLFPLGEWNIGPALSGEFRVSQTILEQMRTMARSGWVAPDAGWVQRFSNRIGNHFFQINATENLFAEQVDRLTRAAAPGSVGSAGAAAENPFATIRTVYNPTGKIIAAIAESGWGGYPARAWDGAAFQRLVRLSYEIRRQRIDTAAIPAFMKQHPEWSTHPSDGRSFVFDGSAGTIGVQNLGKETNGRVFFVHLWRPASPD